MKRYIPVILLAAIGLGVVLGVVVFGVMHKAFSIPCKARVKGVGCGIYWDYNCTILVEEIDWGIIEPGETKTATIYIESKSNVNITLNLTTENWNPPNCTLYMQLTWNYTEAPLTPKSVTPIELYLHVNATITGIDHFTFDIIINAEG